MPKLVDDWHLRHRRLPSTREGGTLKLGQVLVEKGVDQGGFARAGGPAKGNDDWGGGAEAVQHSPVVDLPHHLLGGRASLGDGVDNGQPLLLHLLGKVLWFRLRLPALLAISLAGFLAFTGFLAFAPGLHRLRLGRGTLLGQLVDVALRKEVNVFLHVCVANVAL